MGGFKSLPDEMRWVVGEYGRGLRRVAHINPFWRTPPSCHATSKPLGRDALVQGEQRGTAEKGYNKYWCNEDGLTHFFLDSHCPYGAATQVG